MKPSFTTLALPWALLGASSAIAAQDPVQSAVVELSGMQDATQRILAEGAHSRLLLSKPIGRIAVGDPEILSHETLSELEVLLLGESAGRTSLIIWYRDGTTETLLLSVEPDLSLLRQALADIHPAIQVSIAPDRDAVVLRGVVPDLSFAQTAEAAAHTYLRATSADQNADPVPLGAPGTAPVAPQQTSTSDAAVINLIQVERLPALADVRIQEALHALGWTGVRVSRVTRGLLPDDSLDLFVLEGQVESQVALARVLHLAARAILGGDQANDVRVMADEGGAISLGGNGNFQANNGGQQGGQTPFSTNAGGVFGGAGASGRGQLTNRISSNLGRAKVIQAAEGRLLSFVEVSELPQVRVDIRIYEVNRSEILSQGANLVGIVSDFNQGDLLPAGGAAAAQGSGAASVGGGASGKDIQDVLSFLDSGASNQLQIAGENVALDATFSLLESLGMARSLGRPTLTVLSGELAQFQVGGEVPISQSFATATTTGSPDGVTPGVFNSVVFRPFGVQLGVRPLVDEDGRITVDLLPEIVQPDDELTTLLRETTGQTQQSFGFETRALRTTARLLDGQAMLIGGLVSRSRSKSESRVPLLHELPVLGWLFRREEISEEELELVIVVHPTVVREPNNRARLWMFPDPLNALQSAVARTEELPGNSEPGGNS